MTGFFSLFSHPLLVLTLPGAELVVFNLAAASFSVAVVLGLDTFDKGLSTEALFVGVNGITLP